MCGFYITNLSIEEEEAKQRIESIKYRGPDNTSIRRFGNLILGHLRLSIMDLDKRANQPMKRGNLHIVYNGEIYNFQQLKLELKKNGHDFSTNSDTEVLLAGYQQWGEEVVTRLNGMFAFCIFDQEKQIVFGARDRLGVKPFYYSWKSEGFEMSSQLTPIKQNKIISEEALSIFYDCGYVPSPFSIYKDVFKLPPGNCIKINLLKNTKSIRCYWDLQKRKESKISYLEAKKKLHDLLKDAVKIRMQSDVPIGIFLSGGIDSALITAIAKNNSKELINTITIGFENKKFNEAEKAELIAKNIGTIHREESFGSKDLLDLIPKFIEAFDEPFSDITALPLILLSQKSKTNMTVALTGDGGDESFLGYNHFAWVKWYRNISRIPSFLRGLISLIFIPIPGLIGKKRVLYLKNILKYKTQNEFIRSIFTGFISLQLVPTNNWYSHYQKYHHLSKESIQEAADLNIKLWLENDSNTKVDRSSMINSMEVRSPFLDYRIIEFSRSLPISYRITRGKRKRILKDILSEYIPKAIFDGKKKGFSVPISLWIRHEIKDEILKYLSDNFLNQLPNFNCIEFKKMLDMHMKGKEDYGDYIWRIYVLSKWMGTNK